MRNGITEAQKQGLRDAIDSLKLYRRAELIDEQNSLPIIEQLYVDPRPGVEIFRAILKPNTTLLIGRKGTGKSTIFQKLQQELRNSKNAISVYVDVKTLFTDAEMAHLSGLVEAVSDPALTIEFTQQLSLARSFIDLVTHNIVSEIIARAGENYFHQLKNAIFKSKKKAIEQIKEMMDVNRYVTSLDVSRIQLGLREINRKEESAEESNTSLDIKLALKPSAKGRGTQRNVALKSGVNSSNFKEALLRQFNFIRFAEDLRGVLAQIGIKRLYILVDDFSELPPDAMHIFVSNIMSPLNNASNEMVKFKIAAYPGRIQLGDIDRTKIDEIYLDQYELYGSDNIGTMEEKSIDFIKRLFGKRVKHFCGMSAEVWFDGDEAEVWKSLSDASFANPRVLGYILHYVLQDSIAYGKGISVGSVKQAAEKYYSEKVESFFINGRYADIAIEEKASVLSLKQLMEAIVFKSRELKSYTNNNLFRSMHKELKSVPTSHFHVQKRIEDVFQTLELNGFLSKYSERRDKEGREVSIFAINYGLCNRSNIQYGIPSGRAYRQYPVERVFDYTPIIEEFLASSQRLRCEDGDCNHEEGRDKLESLQLYGMLCPKCRTGKMKISHLIESYRGQIAGVPEELLLPDIELKILNTLYHSNRQMYSRELALELDCSAHQIGSHAKNLVERELVERRKKSGRSVYSLTQRAKTSYFNQEDLEKTRVSCPPRGAPLEA